MRRALLVAAALTTLGAACGNGGSSSSGSASSGPTTTEPTSTSTTATTAPAGFATTEISTPPAQRGLLAAVRATAEGGVERVTFEFEGALPGYRVGYSQRPVIEDGSGKEIQIEGDAILLVHFEPASGFDLESPGGRQVYRGPTRLDLATTTITDVARAGDFEAQLQWAVGLAAKVPFRVRTETSPNRVVVEVQPAPRY